MDSGLFICYCLKCPRNIRSSTALLKTDFQDPFPVFAYPAKVGLFLTSSRSNLR